MAYRDKEKQAAWVRRRREKDPFYFRRYNLKANYGLTLEQFEAMRTAQENKCPICGKEFKTVPQVDHSAITMKVRGLLCLRCNVLLAQAEENIEILENAREYLIHYGANDPYYQRAYQSRLAEIKNPIDWASRDGQDNVYGDGPEPWCGDM